MPAQDSSNYPGTTILILWRGKIQRHKFLTLCCAAGAARGRNVSVGRAARGPDVPGGGAARARSPDVPGGGAARGPEAPGGAARGPEAPGGAARGPEAPGGAARSTWQRHEMSTVERRQPRSIENVFFDLDIELSRPECRACVAYGSS